jgi:hypothetical protein
MKITATIFICLFIFCKPASAQTQRDYISKKMEATGFHLSINDLNQWRQEQKKMLLQKIDELPDSVKTVLIENAKKALDYNWPALPASFYLQYKQNGNRSNFENKLNERRGKLNALVIGWLVSHDEQFIPQIANGLWATLEESTWVLPAHIVMQKMGSGLPDPAEEIIDLVAGETSADISAIQFMLNDPLQQYSPVINKRIEFELNKRIIVPYLERTDFWWMGYGKREVNNWNPWINCNILNSVLYTEQNEDTLNLMIQKLGKSVDFFINGYGEDGGCDEGPTYWSEAGGKLIRFLCLLQSVSNDKLTWANEPLLHNMGSYIFKMHIAGFYFVNFADALPKTIPNPQSVYQYGTYFNDDTLRHFAAFLFSLQNKKLAEGSVNNFLEAIDLFGAISKTDTKIPALQTAWSPQLQVMTAQSIKPDREIFLAVQGGNNGESHNHNDVGNFILYINGNPVIVDAGVGTYTAKTFSSQRYTLWNMQSQWHNCPMINGVQQMDGRQYKASGIEFSNSPDQTSLSMNLSEAYPSTAAVKFWKRNFVFDREKQELRLTEQYKLDKWVDSSRINFLSLAKPVVKEDGSIAFEDEHGKTVLNLQYPKNIFEIRIEKKEMDDARLKSSWKDGLYRTNFVIKNKSLKGSLNFVFK